MKHILKTHHSDTILKKIETPSAYEVYNSLNSKAQFDILSKSEKKQLKRKSLAIRKKKHELKIKELTNKLLGNKKLTNDTVSNVARKPLLKHSSFYEVNGRVKKTIKTVNKKSNFVTPNAIDAEALKKPVDLLNYLLSPIKLSHFFDKYWEKRHIHVSRNNGNYFGNILTSKMLDAILRDNLLHYSRNVDVVTYEQGERITHNPDGRALPANVWDYYANGCSVRILNPQTYNPKIRDILSSLQEYFGTMVGVNVYLTPPASQGFAPHYDDIEAFVIQLEGHKNWTIYAPKNEGACLPRVSSHNFSRDDLGAPLEKLTVRAGDLLYFPRGYVHEASTDANEHSLHITVSVYQNTAYVDLLEKLLPEALRCASECDINYRKGLPLNYLKHLGAVNSNKDTPERSEVSEKVKELMGKLFDYCSVDMAADQLGRKFMYEALPPTLSSSEKNRSCKEDGDRLCNGVVENRITFSPDTKVRLTRYYSQRLLIENGVAKIYYCTENANVYHGEEEQSLELEDSLVDTFKKLQNMYPLYISVEKLPGDQIKNIEAVSQLWERGLIITKAPYISDEEQ